VDRLRLVFKRFCWDLKWHQTVVVGKSILDKKCEAVIVKQFLFVFDEIGSLISINLKTAIITQSH
jgi:hypothetical protein